MTDSLIAIVDTETSSLDPSTGHLLEVAVATWSIEYASGVRSFASLLRGPSNEAEKINRIPSALCASDLAVSRDAVMRAVCHLAAGCTCIVAHHADFDRSWLPELHASTWVDSCSDIEWAEAGSSRALIPLLAAHEIPIGRAHRAASDVDMIARLFEWHARHGHDVQAMLTRAMRPKARYIVADTDFSEERNALVKAAGFRWEKPHWTRTMARDDVAALPFQVREVA